MPFGAEPIFSVRNPGKNHFLVLGLLRNTIYGEIAYFALFWPVYRPFPPSPTSTCLSVWHGIVGKHGFVLENGRRMRYRAFSAIQGPDWPPQGLPLRKSLVTQPFSPISAFFATVLPSDFLSSRTHFFGLEPGKKVLGLLRTRFLLKISLFCPISSCALWKLLYGCSSPS